MKAPKSTSTPPTTAAAAAPSRKRKASSADKPAGTSDTSAGGAPRKKAKKTDVKAQIAAKLPAKLKKKFFATKPSASSKSTAAAAAAAGAASGDDSEASASTDLEAGGIDAWGWREVPIPQGALLTGSDDSGGFMMLEEIDGVEVVEEGDLIKFKRSKKVKGDSAAERKPVTAANQPMSAEEMEAMGFIHVDSILPDDNPEDVKQLTKAAQNAEKTFKDGESDSDVGEDDEEPTLETDDEEEDEDTMDVDDAEPAVTDIAPTAAAPTPEPATPAAPIPRPTDLADPEDLDLDVMSAWTEAAPTLSPWLLKGLSDLGFTSPTPIQSQSIPFVIQNHRNVVGAAETGSGKTLAFGLPMLNHLATSEHVISHPIGLVLSPTRELALQIVDHLKAVAKPLSYSHKLNRVNIVPLVGGFSEDKQRRLLNSTPHIIVATPGRLWDLIESGQLEGRLLDTIRYVVLDEADKMLEKGKFKELENILAVMTKTDATAEWDGKTMQVLPSAVSTSTAADKVKRQYLIFSATLPTSGPAYSFRGKEITLKLLLSKLQLKSFATVDVTTDSKMASNLIESKIDCTPDDKDVYLYYLLSRYPGRTLVFVNAISTIRRLVPLLQHLKLKVYPLHAQMQQRQRVKNLERFSASTDGVLVASDVASRGLDIKNIDHVIHYQVPLTSDLYVHRSGRTARGANASGLSIVLVTPKELPAYRKICTQLAKVSLSEFPVELQYMSEFRKRFSLAKKLDALTHTKSKEKHGKTWMQQAAQALEVDLSDEEEDSDVESREDAMHVKKSGDLRGQLDALLATAILPRGTSQRYIKPQIAQAMNVANNKAMPAAGMRALDEMKELKKKQRAKKIGSV